MLVGAACVLTAISANAASADRTYTTVVRETVYHYPSKVVVSPKVFIPVYRSVYVGIGSGTVVSQTVVSHQPRQTVVYREVTRHHDRHDEDYYRDSSYRLGSDHDRVNDYHRDKDYRFGATQTVVMATGTGTKSQCVVAGRVQINAVM
jgi:hypothetical protein